MGLALVFFFFFFSYWETQLNCNFLGPSRKNDRDNSLVEKTRWRGNFFFFFFVVIFSSFGLTAGCFKLDRLVFALIPKLMQDNQTQN